MYTVYKRDQVVQIVATGNCTTKIILSSYRWSPDVVTLYVEPQFTTVYKRGHMIATMATQMSGPSAQPTNCSLIGETYGWLSWLHLGPTRLVEAF